MNYPVVLVRLPRIHTDALRDLLGMAWQFVATKKLAAQEHDSTGGAIRASAFTPTRGRA